jgi:flavin-dependent dehydrogenase
LSSSITILGSGPAGSAAALAALREGAPVQLIDRSSFPRHKVCGEFLSPEIELDLTSLGVWDAFLAARPARIERMKLVFGHREKSGRLRQPAWGLSRYAFDSLLRDAALAAGAQPGAEAVAPPEIIATGRSSAETRRGQRLFGFKAHFEGPQDRAVELFFFRPCYVGLNSVESGRTNVCGLAPEDWLRRFEFDFDAALRSSPALAERVAPLTRATRWFSTGPLEFRQRFSADAHQYVAGDALSFVDPFTGSGLSAAIHSGSLAGTAAARRLPVEEYNDVCRAALRTPFEVSSVLRAAICAGCADWLAELIPARALFALTRPR